MNKFFLIFNFTFLIFNFVYASEILDSAYQIEKGKFRSVIYYSSFENNPIFKLKEKNDQLYGISGYTETEISCTGKGEISGIKVLFNPFDGFVWWGKLGSCNYILEVPSYSVANKFELDRPGLLVGFGLRYQIFPETIVNPGMCLDFGLTVSEYKFKKFSVDGSSREIINNRFETIEGQTAFLLSKRYKIFEPYCGVKIFRSFSKITDCDFFSSVEGYRDNVSVFIGTKIRVKKFEWFVLEYSFIDETNIAIGIGIGL